MANDDKCPIWGTAVDYIGGGNTSPSRGRGFDVDSARAGGKYSISRTAKNTLNNFDSSEKSRITTWIIKQHRSGEEWPMITTKKIEEIKNYPPLSVHKRADNLLRYLNEKSDLLGTVIKFYELDNEKAPETANELLAWTESTTISEVITLAEYCNEESWIEGKITNRSSGGNTVHILRLRPPGYARLAELDGTNSGLTQAFVAMWFDDSTHDAYENGIASGIREAGFEPLRIDRKEHNNKIDDEIIAEIRRSRFVVADFTQDETGARGGVYYEAGFAHGLNIPVIFTCREDALDKVHFDTQQYNHIVWETPEELCEKLSQRISATIGDGPFKI